MTTTHTHPGRCTTAPTFTRDQAVETLGLLGYVLDPSRTAWIAADGSMGGRLEWVADFCNPDRFNDGTEFYLPARSARSPPSSAETEL